MSEIEVITCGENAQLVARLLSHGVDFLIVGGAAVAHHGCRDINDIDDLDLMLRPSLENMQKFIKSYKSLNYVPQWTAKQLAVKCLLLPLKAMTYLDIMTTPKDVEYQTLDDSSEPMLLNGLTVRVICKNHLIEFKRKASEPQSPNRDKHARDLKCLLGA